MFKAVNKITGVIQNIYNVKEENGELVFLYYDYKYKLWKWCYAKCFEPVVE